jgi:acetyltransferase-like isoleucine patch superfamily enzyme
MTLLEVASVGRACRHRRTVYPEHSQPRWAAAGGFAVRALGRRCRMAPGVVIRPGAEIGDGTGWVRVW